MSRPQPQPGPARPLKNMPLNRRTRRRLALTSALNNPDALPDIMHAALQQTTSIGMPSTPETARALTDNPPIPHHSRPLVSRSTSPEAKPSRQEQRKRRKLEKQQDSDNQLTSMGHADDESSNGPIDAGPSYTSRPGGLAPTTEASPSDTTAHQPSRTAPTIQQQLHERSKLLAGQEEGKARLEARVETLGKEVAFKDDVRGICSARPIPDDADLLSKTAPFRSFQYTRASQAKLYLQHLL